MSAQSQMTPELLWKLGRVSVLGISKDGNEILYKVATPSIEENQSQSKYFAIPIQGGQPKELKNYKDLIIDKNASPDGNYLLSTSEVKLEQVLGKDLYPNLTKSDAKVYNSLNYRHWDTWNEGGYNHVFYAPVSNPNNKVDILKEEPFDCPLKPHGGEEDFIWAPDSKSIIYVAKKKHGTAYATSTNTDIYQYFIESGETINRSQSNLGYDTNPAFSKSGKLAWLQMHHDGNESDKNDIVVDFDGTTINLTASWDGTVENYQWNDAGDLIYFVAPIQGTKQLFSVNVAKDKSKVKVIQLTNGDFDVADIVTIKNSSLIVTRTDMNHATELFSFDLKSKEWKQLTNTNSDIYKNITPSKTEKRFVTTTDGKKMVVWVIYPPNFDATKKYPTLLYCQGGPQSPLTQSYSFRWNFSLIAAKGYIVVAPNRRGMPGHGVEWNAQISKDWGGQVMDDYLSAIDEVSKEKFVDKTRLGAVGASFGGYSVFYLAGIHNNRFKTFISHCGVFNLQSMYGTTEEVFFNNWDHGGAYWELDNPDAKNAYGKFNPINMVNKWNTPILIIQGGKDYRVPIGQAQEAFQAAQLKGIKSRFLLFPEENHWVLKPQNGLVWQYEFFKWLKETL